MSLFFWWTPNEKASWLCWFLLHESSKVKFKKKTRVKWRRGRRSVGGSVVFLPWFPRLLFIYFISLRHSYVVALQKSHISLSLSRVCVCVCKKKRNVSKMATETDVSLAFGGRVAILSLPLSLSLSLCLSLSLSRPLLSFFGSRNQKCFE